MTTPSHQPSLHHASTGVPISTLRAVESLGGRGRTVRRPGHLMPSLSGLATWYAGIDSYNVKHVKYQTAFPD